MASDAGPNNPGFLFVRIFGIAGKLSVDGRQTMDSAFIQTLRMTERDGSSWARWRGPVHLRPRRAISPFVVSRSSTCTPAHSLCVRRMERSGLCSTQIVH